jgi:hypothetical protein
MLSYLLELTSPAGQHLYAGPTLRAAAQPSKAPPPGNKQLLVPYGRMVKVCAWAGAGRGGLHARSALDPSSTARGILGL